MSEHEPRYRIRRLSLSEIATFSERWQAELTARPWIIEITHVYAGKEQWVRYGNAATEQGALTRLDMIKKVGEHRRRPGETRQEWINRTKGTGKGN